MITGISVVITRRVGLPPPGGWPGESDAWAVGGASLPERGGMATKRLSMQHTREILRQKWVLGRSHREGARSLGISNGTLGPVPGGSTAWPRARCGGGCSIEQKNAKLKGWHGLARAGSCGS